ncbi:3D domain-containing protein [Massilia sp. SR12]
MKIHRMGGWLLLFAGASARAADCTVPGTWSDVFGGQFAITSALTGTGKFPYCSADHSLTITLNGTTGFTVRARYNGGQDCQGFSETLTFAANCVTAAGTYRNDDGSSGVDTWSKSGPFISLARTTLTTARATGTPAGGTFAYGTEAIAGGNLAVVAMANGATPTSNPNDITFTAPASGGAPTPGGLARLIARYELNGAEARNKLNRVATFGMSCYMLALESDYGTQPNACSATTIYGTRYSGTVVNPGGLQGTYCASFIANVRLQGSGQLNGGGYINYNVNTRQFVAVASVNGADGTPVVAGQTVARDRAIIPGRGVLVDVDGVGTGLLANDTGGAIRGYRLDLYNGAGRAACAGYANPLGVGACQTPQASCPGRDMQ